MHWRFKRKGSITIFCCLCLTIWIACVGVLLESARVRGLASRLDRTASSSLESVMADYNKTIMERYNLFLLDYGEGTDNKKEALARWNTYFKKESNEAMGNLLYQLLFDSEWFSITKADCNIVTTWTLLDQSGKLLANQVAQYMKYKEVGNLVSTLLEQIKIIQKGIEGQETLNSFWKKENTSVSLETCTLNWQSEEGVSLLLTANIDASSKKISEVGLPSRLQGITDNHIGDSPIWNDVSEEVLIGAYILEYFTSYVDDINHKERMGCQQEYILFGGLSDKENMKSVTNLLLTVRCGLNLISLLSSESMQAAVETTAITISSALLNPELAPVVQVVLNCMWAYMESEHDLENLLKGEKVPFLKEESQWIESILTFGQEEKAEEQIESVEKDDNHLDRVDAVKKELQEIGEAEKKFYSVEMSYEDYIRIFLLFVTPEVKYYRVMDMIQVEMQNKYPSFMISNCICGIEATVSVKGKAKFLMFIPWNAKQRYELTRTVSFLY